MTTPICSELGIEFPIFAFSHCRDVVAAVTNAGGFGVLDQADDAQHVVLQRHGVQRRLEGHGGVQEVAAGPAHRPRAPDPRHVPHRHALGQPP